MSFRLKTILGVAFIQLVLLLSLIASVLGYLSQSNEALLQQRADNTAGLLARASADAVLGNDRATLNTLVEEVLGDSDVVYVRVRAGDSVLASGGAEAIDSAAHLQPAQGAVFEARAPIRMANAVYGTVELGLSTRTIEEVLTRATSWAVTIAIAGIVVVALFSFVLASYLTSQLRRLQLGAETVLSHGPGHQVPVAGNDELAAVTRSFNKMSAGLASSMQDLQSALAQHRLLAAAASRSESMNKAVLAASLDGFITIDADGLVVEYNAVAESMFGWTREQMLGRTLAKTIIPPRYRDAHEAGIRHYLATGDGPVMGRRVELEALHKDGHVFAVELAISPMRADDAVMFTAFMRDVSERKRHEDSLRLARTEAEQASEAKSRFLATMSHEIRSPLNALVSMSSLLLETDLNAEQREFARVASEGGQTLMALINDILDFSQIESGRMILNCTAFDLVQLVNGVVELFCAQAHSRQIEIVSVIAPAVAGSVHGDELRVRQILTNLIGNAVKFTEQGGVLVRVAVSADGEIVIDVQDTGVGIAKESQARIFEEFVQAEDSDSRRFAGSGLGLTIVQRLVKLMGGRLSVRSVPGRGTRFRVRLPLPLQAQSTAADLAVCTDRGVCLCLSNRVLARGLRDQLRLVGVPVFTLQQLHERTRRLPGEMVMLVDADVQAVQLAQHRTRAVQAAAHLRWRFVTMVPMDQLGRAEQARAGGYDGLLRTPVRLRTLLQCVAGHGDEPAGSVRGAARDDPAAYDDETLSPNDGPAILLVEDSAANRAVALALLHREGYQVSVAENGVQALQLAAKDTFSLILMDLAMPEMDGLTATRRLRAEAGPNRRTPIVAMTANAFAEDRERCLAAGMDDYLSKPIDIPVFREKVRQWVEDVMERTGAFNRVQATDIEAVIDERILYKIAEETSRDAIPELIKIFIDEAQERLPRLLSALEAIDAGAVLDEAHALKSSAGSFGAIRLQALAREIEQAAHSGDTTAMSNAAAGLSAITAQSIAALRRFVDTHRDATPAD